MFKNQNALCFLPRDASAERGYEIAWVEENRELYDIRVFVLLYEVNLVMVL